LLQKHNKTKHRKWRGEGKAKEKFKRKTVSRFVAVGEKKYLKEKRGGSGLDTSLKGGIRKKYKRWRKELVGEEGDRGKKVEKKRKPAGGGEKGGTIKACGKGETKEKKSKTKN